MFCVPPSRFEAPNVKYYSPEETASAMHVLCSSGAWQPLYHIRIPFDDGSVSAREIIETTDRDDFAVRRHYLYKVLQIKYGEIVDQFDGTLSAALDACNGLKRDGGDGGDSGSSERFTACARQLYDSFGDSEIMFDRMLKALSTMRTMAINKDDNGGGGGTLTVRNYKTPLERLVEDLVAFIGWAKRKFSGGWGRSTRRTANEYLEAVSAFRENHVKTNLMTLTRINEKIKSAAEKKGRPGEATASGEVKEEEPPMVDSNDFERLFENLQRIRQHAMVDCYEKLGFTWFL